VVEQPFHQKAEEAVGIGLADDQVERELDGVALNAGHALCPVALTGFVLDHHSQLAL